MGADGGYKLQGLLDIVGLDELKAIKSNPKQELLSFFFSFNLKENNPEFNLQTLHQN
jgi:hypothetical protein